MSSRRILGRLAATGGLGSYGYYMYVNYEDARAKEQKTHVPPFRMMMYRWLPVTTMTRLAGSFAETTIPQSLRVPVYGLYAKMFGCNMEESVGGLGDFVNFQEFFTRRVKSDSRPVDSEAALVAPSDGRIMAMGRIDPPFAEANGETMLFPEQIKGVSYPLKELVTQEVYDDLSRSKNKPIYYCTIYLAPGDYHRFHSPTEWRQNGKATLVPGEVLSVAPYMMRWVRNLLCLNVRSIISGSWSHGHFSMIPVGATNVSSIQLDPTKKILKRGDQVGMFRMGSTVVLLFHGPPNFTWVPSVGDRIKMGQPLGQIPRTYRFINGLF